MQDKLLFYIDVTLYRAFFCCSLRVEHMDEIMGVADVLIALLFTVPHVKSVLLI